MIDSILKNFNKSLADKISTFSDIKEIAKKDYFIKAGQTDHHLAIVNDGFLQSFYYKNGKEITTYLAGPGKLVVSLASYLNQVPSKEYIRALTDTELILIHKKDIDRLTAEDDNFRQFYIQTLEYQIVCIDESRFDFITLSAEERYLKLFSEEPQIFQQISLKYIASILGITERQITRIRKKIIENKIQTNV